MHKDYINHQAASDKPEDIRELKNTDSTQTTNNTANNNTPTSNTDGIQMEKLLADYDGSQLAYPLPAPFVQLLKLGLPYSHITGPENNIASEYYEFIIYMILKLNPYNEVKQKARILLLNFQKF